MNGGDKAPKPPDPYKTASAQTGSNQSTAMYEQMLNMQDQRTPYGSMTWQPSGTWTYKDPTSGKDVTVPKFMASSVLSPTQQALLDQTQQFDARYNQMALDQADRVKGSLSEPFDYNPGIHEAWAGDIYNRLNKDTIDAGENELRQSLANRGLNIGTEAYDKGMRNFYEANQRSRDAFMLDSYGTGMNTALTKRNQPLKEGMALMGAGQITEPQWLAGPQSGVNGTDVAGITAGAYNQQLARTQMNNQQAAGVWGALGQLGGAALGGWLSDKRAKEDIESAGYDEESGLPVKEWEYKGSERRHRTPLAQDVERKYPHAVSKRDGMKRVDWRSIPGGDKFREDMQREIPDDNEYPGGGLYHRNPERDMPKGLRHRGKEMLVPGDDPYYNVDEAAPPVKYRDAKYIDRMPRIEGKGGKKYIDRMPKFEGKKGGKKYIDRMPRIGGLQALGAGRVG